MAEKRMFAKTIIDSDAFLDMSLSAQALYFHLSMRADDEGFINNPNKIQRMIGASNDDMKMLFAKNFIIGFESGVIVIKHWKIHNYIRKDRLVPTVYQAEKATLSVKKNNAYTIDPELNEVKEIDMSGRCQSSDSQVTVKCPSSDGLDHSTLLYSSNTYNSLIEVEPNNKPKKRETLINIYKLIDDAVLDVEVKEVIKTWVDYKKEQFKFEYKPIGFKALLTEIANHVNEIGKENTIRAVQVSMAKGYKGIIWDLVKNNKQSSGSSYIDAIHNRYDIADNWLMTRGEDDDKE